MTVILFSQGSAPADYPVVADVRATVAYDNGNLIGELVIPVLDYPTEDNVLKDVVYNNGSLTGTLEFTLELPSMLTNVSVAVYPSNLLDVVKVYAEEILPATLIGVRHG